jgi:hypothetical protein
MKKIRRQIEEYCVLSVRMSAGIGLSVWNTLLFCRRRADNRTIQLISGQFRLVPVWPRLIYAEPHMVEWLGGLTG